MLFHNNCMIAMAGALLSDYNGCGKGYVNDQPDRPCNIVSVLAAARAALPKTSSVHFERGCDYTDMDSSGMASAVSAAAAADAAVLVVGLISGFNKEHLQIEGEAHDRVNLTLPGLQAELIQKVMDAAWS